MLYEKRNFAGVCVCTLFISMWDWHKGAVKNPQKVLEVGAETTPKSVEATSSPMVQKIKNTSGKRENPKDLKQIKLSVERWDTKQKRFFYSGSQIWHWQWLCFGIWSELGVYFL